MRQYARSSTSSCSESRVSRSFALPPDTDQHAITVEARHAQANDFPDPKPRGIGGHQRRAALGFAVVSNNAHLLTAEDGRPFAVSLGQRNLHGIPGPSQGDSVEEAKPVHGQPAAVPCQLPLADQVQLILAYFGVGELIGWTSVVGGQALHRGQIRSARVLGQPAHDQIALHLIAQFSDDDGLSLRRAREIRKRRGYGVEVIVDRGRRFTEAERSAAARIVLRGDACRRRSPRTQRGVTWSGPQRGLELHRVSGSFKFPTPCRGCSEFETYASALAEAA